jgi:3-methyladenine DNA glycosylase AlkC
VDPFFIGLLDRGVAESRTHVEQMAMSPEALIRHAFPASNLDLTAVAATPFIARLRLVGTALGREYGADLGRANACWISDTIRGWQAMAVADQASSVDEAVAALLPFARDHHFAVREWAWLAVRPWVVDDAVSAIRALESAASSRNAFERRFALEATRPRSVWGRHVQRLKAEPELGLPLLAAARCDSDRYVRSSVANWLNDAARSRPDFVRALVQRWDDCCPSTNDILKRGARNL